jgi:hypothetical protein
LIARAGYANRPLEREMNYDRDKIDEYTLALLYLVSHERHEGLGARAWKGFDWDTMNRLQEGVHIESNRQGKIGRND